ncbi:hypothetical protein [Phytoactinopolyspora halotolerans]|uniref:ASCH domain-containing protein n=1 Tax=Phytoactinopolyspora halotolerans TaxID=1981512 RepID=A0A6L9S4H8_9ACTN|nr:hypothetical protein [Phytoactinopolyspora halotolerans]NEE00046.1 hypothetical protein [Phytoactinopolyspora halotolerans]
MLFEKRFWPGIADGSITVTFRRWKKPQVVAGRPYRTPAGIVDVVAVDVVDPADIDDDDARAAGYADASTLVTDLRGDASRATYRIEFRRSEAPDPRAELAASAELDDGALAEIDRRLDRLDRASGDGAWTRVTLELIAAHPARRAGDLAEMVGRERAPFKLDVRKLKNLGLTESLQVGYRLSPRGRAYLDRRR